MINECNYFVRAWFKWILVSKLETELELYWKTQVHMVQLSHYYVIQIIQFPIHHSNNADQCLIFSRLIWLMIFYKAMLCLNLFCTTVFFLLIKSSRAINFICFPFTVLSFHSVQSWLTQILCHRYQICVSNNPCNEGISRIIICGLIYIISFSTL